MGVAPKTRRAAQASLLGSASSQRQSSAACSRASSVRNARGEPDVRAVMGTVFGRASPLSLARSARSGTTVAVGRTLPERAAAVLSCAATWAAPFGGGGGGAGRHHQPRSGGGLGPQRLPGGCCSAADGCRRRGRGPRGAPRERTHHQPRPPELLHTYKLTWCSSPPLLPLSRLLRRRRRRRAPLTEARGAAAAVSAFK